MAEHAFERVSVVFVLMIACLVSEPVVAQINYGGGDQGGLYQAAGVGYTLNRFTYDGSGVADADFEFNNPLYSIFFARPGFLASVGRGTQSTTDGDDLEMTDASVIASAALRPFDNLGNTSIDLFVPISLDSGYRRVSRDLETATLSAFEFTTIAIGAGVGLERFSNRGGISIQAKPHYGIAVRSFGDGTGSTFIFDTSAEATLRRATSGIGVFLSYGYRFQTWRMDAAEFLQGLPEDSFNYASRSHTARLGITF